MGEYLIKSGYKFLQQEFQNSQLGQFDLECLKPLWEAVWSCWGPKFYMMAHFMKSKEKPWTLTKEDPIHKVKKDHEGPKFQKEGKRKK